MDTTPPLPIPQNLPDKLTSETVSTHLGIPRSKLRFWIAQLKIPVPQDARGGFRFSPEHVAILERVQALREIENRSMDTVRKVLHKPITDLVAPEEESSEDSDDSSESTRELIAQLPSSPLDTDRIVEAIEDLVSELKAQTPSPQAIAKAFEPEVAQVLSPLLRQLESAVSEREVIAKLAESNNVLLQSNQDLNDRMRLASQQFITMNQEITTLRTQLDVAQRQLALPAPKPTGWKAVAARMLGLM